MKKRYLLWSLQFIIQSEAEGITEVAGRTLRAPEPREFFSDDEVLLLGLFRMNAAR
jgi:hypothetical protein